MRLVRLPHAGIAALVLAVAATSLLPTGCTEPIAVHTAMNPAASFDHYRTFSMGSPESSPAGYKTGPRSAEVERRLRPIISATLAQRGYTPVSGKGDLVIMFGSGTRVVDEREASAVAQDWQPDDENADFVEGSLVIDAFDSAKGIRVWHGASRAEIDPDHIDDPLLERSVADLLKTFPRGASGERTRDVAGR